MSRTPIDPALLEIRAFVAADAEVARGFSCGDEDLDDFLRTDAMRSQAQNVVRTFVALYEGDLVGYVALLNDAVVLKSNERKKLAIRSPHPIVPALKIARLGVSKDFRARHRGVGEVLMYYAYASAHDLAERVGCRLLTLDAYPESIAFYERLGFVRNQDKAYEGRAHPSMRLDLFAPAVPAWISGWDGSARPAGGA